jgi:hypothetical protein
MASDEKPDGDNVMKSFDDLLGATPKLSESRAVNLSRSEQEELIRHLLTDQSGSNGQNLSNPEVWELISWNPHETEIYKSLNSSQQRKCQVIALLASYYFDKNQGSADLGEMMKWLEKTLSSGTLGHGEG